MQPPHCALHRVRRPGRPARPERRRARRRRSRPPTSEPRHRIDRRATDKSLSFRLDEPASEIVVAQPDIAEVVATTDRSFYVRGKAARAPPTCWSTTPAAA